MRTLLILHLLILIASAGHAQEPLKFTEVIHVDSVLTKNVLFERARAWLNDAFRDYKEVSQIQDKESGELSVKGIIFTHYAKNGFGQPLANYPSYVRCKITIWVKDGRYKYEFSDYTDGAAGNEMTLTTAETIKDSGAMKNSINDFWKESKTGAINTTNKLTASLKEAMMKPATDNSDW